VLLGALPERDAATALASQHHWLQSLGNKRTPEQSQRYHQLHLWHTYHYTPADEAAWNYRENKAAQRQIIENLNRTAEQFQRQLKQSEQSVTRPVTEALREAFALP
jgi:hypothetical protein